MNKDKIGKEKTLASKVAWTIPIILLLPLILSLVLFMFYGIGKLLPSIAITTPLIVLVNRIKSREILSSFFESLGEMILYPFVVLAWGSPCVAFMELCDSIYPLGGQTTINVFGLTLPGFDFGPWFNVITAVCGIVFGIWIVAGVTTLTGRLTRLMDGTSTSMIKNARPGMREFIGVAKHIDEESLRKTVTSNDELENFRFAGDIEPILLWKKTETSGKDHSETIINRFYIEDNSGKILVDPEGAEFLGPGDIGPRQSLSMIILARRVQTEEIEPEKINKITTAALLPGDPVYLIGPVVNNSNAVKGASGPERLIMKPSLKKEKAGFISRLFFNMDKHIASRDPRNMFVLSDTAELNVKKIISRNTLYAGLFSLIWLIPSSALIVASLIAI